MLLINLLGGRAPSTRALRAQERAKQLGISRLIGQAEYRCSKCSTVKPAVEFFVTRGRVKAWCKRCHGKAGTNYKRSNPEARKRYAWTSRVSRMLQKFGITADDYDRKLEEQGGVCKLCCQPETSPGNSWWGNNGPRMLAVDHAHETSCVRGLLCSNCNRALGLLRDDPVLLRRAALYVETGGLSMELPSVPGVTGVTGSVTSQDGCDDTQDLGSKPYETFTLASRVD